MTDMPTALPLTSMISPGSSRKRGYRTLSAKFGNGYGQDAPDGINDVVDTWSIQYETLTPAQRDTVVTALDTVKGFDYFTWQAPGDGASKKWKLQPKEWSETTTGYSYNVSFTLEQIY